MFFDLETTGTSITKDRIIEICAIRLNPDGRQEELHHLVNPTILIDPAAKRFKGANKGETQVLVLASGTMRRKWSANTPKHSLVISGSNRAIQLPVADAKAA